MASLVAKLVLDDLFGDAAILRKPGDDKFWKGLW